MSENLEWLDKAFSKYMTGKLVQFRASLEQEAEHSIGDLEINAALLLSDLCHFLGLDEQQHDRVLGEAGVTHVMQVLDTRVSLLTAYMVAPQESDRELVEA